MHDNKGLGPMNPMLLPANLGDMLNDPYRTLSRWVRESCGYLKSGKDQCATFGPGASSWFMEFSWADFLRGTTPIASAEKPVCVSMPYTKECLPNQVGALVMLYPSAMKAAESEQAKQYFESLGLDPVQYGFNSSGQHLGLNISTEGCESLTN